MSIKSIRTGWTGISALAGNDQWFSDFESIASVTVGEGGVGNVEFTSIPSTYTHLQVRGIQRGATSGTGADSSLLTFNSDTENNYSAHRLQGDGASTPTSDAFTTRGDVIISSLPRAGVTASTFNGFIIDILDYASTNKAKTVRILSGYDANGSGSMWLLSGRWGKTPLEAISSLKITAGGSTPTFVQHSHFALYGIRG